VLKNTLKIPKRRVSALYHEYGKECGWGHVGQVIDSKGVITLRGKNDKLDIFNEHLISILIDYGAKGTVRFGRLDSAEPAEFWGYTFDGKGKIFREKGSIVWSKGQRK
tara:strand:- start:209 stop:532 length:324 start_codon:yes stop_codon:yes gene_type:complete